jgi:hypothetical protein
MLAARIDGAHQPALASCEIAADTVPSVALNCMTLVPAPDFPERAGWFSLSGSVSVRRRGAC